MIIAVDGPAAAGKGTISRALAEHFGYHFLDTGSLYRMVGLAMLRHGSDPEDGATAAATARNLDPAAFDDGELRNETVGRAASIVAANQDVRAALLDFQRDFARQEPGVVLDGRDIGTVVCPEADVKLFITASPEVRARRRQKELGTVDYEEILADILERDKRDSSRATAPLVPASDALVIDTSEFSADEAVRRVLAIVGG